MLLFLFFGAWASLPLKPLPSWLILAFLRWAKAVVELFVAAFAVTNVATKRAKVMIVVFMFLCFLFV